MKLVLLVFGSLAAGVGAINTFILAWPGDLVSQGVLLGLGAVNAGLAASLTFLISRAEVYDVQR
jgi:hypothetical protein